MMLLHLATPHVLPFEAYAFLLGAYLRSGHLPIGLRMHFAVRHVFCLLLT